MWIRDGADVWLCKREDRSLRRGGGQAQGSKAKLFLLIPNPTDENPCAHSRSPMDMIFQGMSMSVNGGVKAGHWGGAKTGQFAAWASSTTRHGRPGGDGRGFVAGAAVAFRNL